MKYLICQNNKGSGKYFKGRVCNEQVQVDNSTVSVLCWKCLALLMPMPEEKKPTGYPRGWKFMSEFVDKDGNVYHKGELQQDLFGTLPPTEIKETKKERKRKTSLDDKILSEFKKRNSKKKSKKK
jgi:hypothetical protein